MKNVIGEELKEDCYIVVWLKGYGDLPFIGVKNSIFGWNVFGVKKDIFDSDVVDFAYIKRNKR